MKSTDDRRSLYEKIPDELMPVRFKTATNSKFDIHWHEHIEIHYVMKGHFSVRCENETVTVEEDSFAIINSNELHQGVGGDCTRAFMIVPPSFLGKRNVIIKRHIKDGYLSELFNRMIAEFDSPDEYTPEALNGYSRLFMTHLYRNYVYESINESRYDSYSERTIGLNMAVKYIHDNYNKEISLDDLARLTNFSKYYFCSLFREFTGESFREYQNRLRIRRATELLRDTVLSVTDIAFACGFNDSNYFSRKFKQITGRTPSEARNFK